MTVPGAPPLSPDGQYHAFREITAVEAAKGRGAKETGKNKSKRTFPAMYKEVWDKS